MQTQFIPGIFNYCDRWCERCAFTSRCRTYERTSNLSPEQNDISNKAFWDTIADNFKAAFEMLHKAAEEHGIDLNNIPEQETRDYEERRSFLKLQTKEHILVKLCKQYQASVRPFLTETFKEEYTDTANELISHLQMGIKQEDDIKQTMATLYDCNEVIQWYLYFIDAKLQRALHGLLANDEDNGFPKDSDGSAKIALIAIERSMGAWSQLHKLLPGAEDVALKALSVLSRLYKETNEYFPNAIIFHRPGFDD